MPGIAGILTRDLLRAPELLEIMLQSMIHGPARARVSRGNADHGWFVGSTATPDTNSGRMPLSSEDGSVTLWFTGECFVDASTKALLKRSGHDCAPGDAECLVHLYEEEGPRFFGKLNGLFSGILLDARLGKAILFTDRFSLRRIYYHEDESGFYFASEAKALLAALPHLRGIDSQSLAEYLCFDCVLGGKSFFQGIQVLPGGALWIAERGRLEKTCSYDSQTCEEQSPLGQAEFCDRLGSAFERAVHRRIEGGKVGLALSGGLDTRLIASCLPADCQSVTAFTASGMYRDSMDLRIARKLCKRSSIEHETIRLDSEFLTDYASIAARTVYVTDGLADATNAHNYYLDGKVRRAIAPVVLSGDFGSQILGRVRPGLRYRPPEPGLVHGDFQPYLAESAGALAALPPENNLAHMANREIPWYWSRYVSAHLSQYDVRLPFLDNDFFDLLFRAPREGFDGSEFEMAAITRRKPELMRLHTNQGRGGAAPQPILGLVRRHIRYRAKVEKIFNWDTLPHSLHHWAARVDACFLYPLHLDRLILGWEYYSHYNRWFRKELAPVLQSVLLDAKTLARPFWNSASVTQLVSDHVQGRRNNLSQIRKILTIELIHRELLERTPRKCGRPDSVELHAAQAN